MDITDTRERLQNEIRIIERSVELIGRFFTNPDFSRDYQSLLELSVLRKDLSVVGAMSDYMHLRCYAGYTASTALSSLKRQYSDAKNGVVNHHT